MHKKPEITEQTKNNLQQAFWSVYGKKPIEKISIKEITDLAGYNRGTFYLYYQDIYDILDQSENEILMKIDNILKKNLGEIVELNLSGLITSVMELVHPYSDYSTILLGDNGDPKFASKLKELLRPFLLKGFLSKVEDYTDYQRELLEEFWLSGMLGIVQKWTFDPQISLEELISFIIPSIYPMKKE